MSAANPNPMEKSMVSVLVVANAGGGSPLLRRSSFLSAYGIHHSFDGGDGKVSKKKKQTTLRHGM
jgi:hypothetical protein